MGQPSTQTCLDELLTKSNEGTLTSEERTELADLVAEYERTITPPYASAVESA